VRAASPLAAMPEPAGTPPVMPPLVSMPRAAPVLLVPAPVPVPVTPLAASPMPPGT